MKPLAVAVVVPARAPSDRGVGLGEVFLLPRLDVRIGVVTVTPLARVLARPPGRCEAVAVIVPERVLARVCHRVAFIDRAGIIVNAMRVEGARVSAVVLAAVGVISVLAVVALLGPASLQVATDGRAAARPHADALVPIFLDAGGTTAVVRDCS